MKTLILLLLLQSIIIPKGSDQIAVKANFDQVRNALNANGYTISSYQKEFGMIKTEYKSIKGYTVYIHLDIKLIGDSAYIQGGTDDYLIAEYDRGAPKLAFLEMNKFALSIDSNLTYKTVR